MKRSSAFLSWFILILLALIWGSSFILIKKALIAFNPFQIGGLRILIASLALLPFAAGKFKEVKRKEWKYIFLVGLLGNGIPAFLIPFAETVINSATAGMLNSLTPLFTLLIGVISFSLVFSFRKLAGVILGLAGAAILILIGQQEVALTKNALFSSLVMIAAILYAIAVNIIKKHLQHTNTVIITAYALWSVLLPYLIFLIASGTPAMILESREAQTSLIYVAILAVFGTSFALVLFNRLVQITDPVISSSVTYLIPIVAVCWGLIDNEMIGWPQLLGMGVILSGVYLVNRK